MKNNEWISLGEYQAAKNDLESDEAKLKQTKKKIETTQRGGAAVKWKRVIFSLVLSNVEPVPENNETLKAIEGFISNDANYFKTAKAWNLRSTIASTFSLINTKADIKNLSRIAEFIGYKKSDTSNQTSIKIGESLIIISKTFKKPDIKIKINDGIINKIKYELPPAFIDQKQFRFVLALLANSDNGQMIFKALDALR